MSHSQPFAEAREVGVQEALDRAYRYLGHRDRSVAEVRAHLEGKGAHGSSIDGAIKELLEQGYLDDARFARRFTADKRELETWGSERIERRLQELGVERSSIAAALSAGEVDEVGVAVELLRRRYRIPPETERDRQKALGVLVRKGYELEVAYDALRRFAADWSA